MSAISSKMNSAVLAAMVSGCLRIHILQDTRLDINHLQEILLAMDNAPSEEEIQALLSKDGVITKFLQKAAENRWNCAQLEVEMKDAGIESSSIETFLNVWRKEEAKVVAHIRDKSYWGPKLQRLAWRVDICTRSSNMSEINEPCAVMEMSLNDQGGSPNVLRFEVDKDALTNMHKQVLRLQKALQGAAS
mmetsp:Transcript_13695/g.29210  ORF Transcript_13695/g.29210 Transcript_13695/m.29210 type:complete len:190 (-) Transcript_13695:233-802(-)